MLDIHSDTWDDYGGAGTVEVVGFLQCIVAENVQHVLEETCELLSILRSGPLEDGQANNDAEQFFGQTFPVEQLMTDERPEGGEATDLGRPGEVNRDNATLARSRFLAELTRRLGDKLVVDSDEEVNHIGRVLELGNAVTELRNETWGNVLRRFELDWFVRSGRIHVSEQGWGWNVFSVSEMTKDDLSRMKEQLAKNVVGDEASAAIDLDMGDVFLFPRHIFVNHTADMQRKIREWLRNAGYTPRPEPVPQESQPQ